MNYVLTIFNYSVAMNKWKLLMKFLKYHGFMCILPVYSFKLGNCETIHAPDLPDSYVE